MAEPPTDFNSGESDRDAFRIRMREMDLDAGWLGRLFGSRKNAPVNIAGVAVLGVFGIGAVVTAHPGGAATETWKALAPILTMVLGFVFGRRT